jgi:hypothetical protein
MSGKGERRPLPEHVEQACDKLIGALGRGEEEAARAWADLVEARADAGPRSPDPPWGDAFDAIERCLGEGAGDRVKAEAWVILSARAESFSGQMRAFLRRLQAMAES